MTEFTESAQTNGASEHDEDMLASSPLSSALSDWGDIETPQKPTDGPSAIPSQEQADDMDVDVELPSSSPAKRPTKRKSETPTIENTPTKRVTRTRGSHKRYTEEDSDAELQEATTPVKPVAIENPRKKQPLRGTWSVSHLLENPNSKLAKINLQELLSQDKAWEVLTREEQLELISMLPNTTVPDLPDDIPIPNLVRDNMKKNSAFQADIRLFQDDLAAGRWDPKWIEDAQKAVNLRKKGVFDDWKETNKEKFWGQKQTVNWDALAGDSANYTLNDLFKAGCFEIGDVWMLRRSQGYGKDKLLVEKEARITSISEDYLPTFSFPPLQYKYSSPANGEDIELQDVASPKALGDTMGHEDGRITSRSANSWKDFRCFRNNQDMGTIWDIRELYHQRQQAAVSK